MNIGDKLCLEPTIPTSAFVTARTGPQPCRVVSTWPRSWFSAMSMKVP